MRDILETDHFYLHFIATLNIAKVPIYAIKKNRRMPVFIGGKAKFYNFSEGKCE